MGCAAKVQTQVIRNVPEALIADTPVPVLKGSTNKDLLFFAIELKDALERSNRDKAGIRKWKLGEQK